MRILVTGAAGHVAGLLLPSLDGRYDLRRTDLHGPNPGDLTDEEFVRAIVADVDAVVHLAANANPRAPWEELYGTNVIATATVLEAAATAGVRKIVLASSGHAMGQHVRPGVLVDPELPPAPCCPYGAAKAFAEAAGRVTAYRYGVAVIALRLGAVFPTPPAVEAMSAWLAPADLQQLVIRALDANVSFGVYHGMSANQPAQWDLANDIGYHPIHDASRYAGTIPDEPGWGICPPRHRALAT